MAIKAADKPQVNEAEQDEPGGPAFPGLPSPAALAAARAKRKATGAAVELKHGTVMGLPSGWVAAKMDPSLDAGRKAMLHAKWTGAGWIKLEGEHQVVGYPLGCVVYVKDAGDYQDDRQERDKSLKAAAANGTFMLGHA